MSPWTDASKCICPVHGWFLLAVRVCASLLTKDTFWDSFENKDAFSIDTVICSRLTATEPPPPSSFPLFLLFVPLFSSSEACLTWNILIENRYPRISVRIVSLPLPFTHTDTHSSLTWIAHWGWISVISEWKKKNKLGVIQQINFLFLFLRQLGFARVLNSCRTQSCPGAVGTWSIGSYMREPACWKLAQ